MVRLIGVLEWYSRCAGSSIRVSIRATLCPVGGRSHENYDKKGVTNHLYEIGDLVWLSMNTIRLTHRRPAANICRRPAAGEQNAGQRAGQVKKTKKTYLNWEIFIRTCWVLFNLIKNLFVLINQSLLVVAYGPPSPLLSLSEHYCAENNDIYGRICFIFDLSSLSRLKVVSRQNIFFSRQNCRRRPKTYAAGRRPADKTLAGGKPPVRKPEHYISATSQSAGNTVRRFLGPVKALNDGVQCSIFRITC